MLQIPDPLALHDLDPDSPIPHENDEASSQWFKYYVVINFFYLNIYGHQWKFPCQSPNETLPCFAG